MTARRTILAIVAVACMVSGLLIAQPRVDEYTLKAEYLFRFPLYVDWPETTLGAVDQPFRLAVLGQSPIIQTLENRVRAQPIQGHPVELVTIVSPRDLSGCHMVFIAREAEFELDAVLEWTDGQPILTVSERAGFAEQGVLINLFLADDTVRFEINQDAVRRSGLVLRSKLYRVARVVGGGS